MIRNGRLLSDVVSTGLLAGGIVWLAAGLTGCSSGSGEIQTGSAAIAPPATTTAPQTASVQAASVQVGTPAYQLTEKDQKLNCKQLTGAIKVRVMQLRATAAGEGGTLVARGMQTGATKVFGGPSYGIDPASDRAKDHAQLEAYNQQLAAKKCKTVDLQAELHDQPPPVAAAPKAL